MFDTVLWFTLVLAITGQDGEQYLSEGLRSYPTLEQCKVAAQEFSRIAEPALGYYNIQVGCIEEGPQ